MEITVHPIHVPANLTIRERVKLLDEKIEVNYRHFDHFSCEVELAYDIEVLLIWGDAVELTTDKNILDFMAENNLRPVTPAEYLAFLVEFPGYVEEVDLIICLGAHFDEPKSSDEDGEGDDSMENFTWDWRHYLCHEVEDDQKLLGTDFVDDGIDDGDYWSKKCLFPAVRVK